MGLLDQQSYAGYADEGQRLAVEPMSFTPMDAAKFIAEATPIIGDAMAAKEIYDELQRPEPDLGYVAVLGGAALLGLIPLIGDAASPAIKKVGKGLLDMADRIEVDPSVMGMSFGNIKLNPKADPTQTGWTFRDVEKPVLNKEENRRVSALTSRVEEVPINQIYATQPTVNPDFSTTSSSAGELPFVVRKNGKMFVQDGHHRLTKLAEEGVQNAKVRFIDLDGAETSTPLLDYDPNFNSEIKGILDTLSSPPLPKPKNKAEKTAKEILELRAKGEAKYVTDEMMSMADPQYMFNNTPLDMSQEARMARASDAGFDVDKLMYRGSPQNESVIDRDRLFSSDSGYVASTYAKGGSLPNAQTNSVVAPILTRPKNAYTIDQKGSYFERIPIDKPISGKNNTLRDQFGDEIKTWNVNGVPTTDTNRIASLGMKEFDSIQFDNIVDRGSEVYYKFTEPQQYYTIPTTGETFPLGRASTVDKDFQAQTRIPSTVRINRPEDVKSQFARFDPEFKHLKNLTAAGLLTPSAILALQEYKKQEELERGLLSY